MFAENLRITDNDKLAGSIRLVLAVMFLMAGAMKLFVPMLADAWTGQLLAANIPFYMLSRWSVPFLEILLGIALGLGIFVRVAALLVIAIMAVATYVHMVVTDPSLFPLQPTEPVIPIVVIILCGYLLWRGAGAWSSDVRATQI